MLELNIHLIQFKHKTFVDFNVDIVKYRLHRNCIYEKSEFRRIAASDYLIASIQSMSTPFLDLFSRHVSKLNVFSTAIAIYKYTLYQHHLFLFRYPSPTRIEHVNQSTNFETARHPQKPVYTQNICSD